MTTVIESQSLLDIALQENGNVLCAFELAIASSINITDDLLPGQQLKEVKSDLSLNEVVDYFKGKGKLIATKPTIVAEIEPLTYGLPEGEMPFSL